MQPNRQDMQEVLEPGAAQKPKRFRIVKLEERIAPSKGGNGTNNCGGYTDKCHTLSCAPCSAACW